MTTTANANFAPATAKTTVALWRLAGGAAEAVERLTITGDDQVLASSFEVTRAATALVAATNLAVAEISDLTTGLDGADVEVDSTHSCVAFQSERHLRVEQQGRLWDELSGHYEAADGHVQYHTNFDHHRVGLLTALGLADGSARAAVEEATARLGREELERIVSDAGGIAAALRTLDEWTAHPHGQAASDGVPLSMARVSDTPANALPHAPADRPLAGLKVLDMTRVIAGPVCGRILAAWGADVLRIGADGLPVVDSILPDTTLGKRFAELDLRTDPGRARLFELIADADVVVTGFRPGALEGVGVTRKQMTEANPTLVTGELSAFGTIGPWGTRRGFDSITQTATGIVHAETTAFEAAGMSTGRPRPLPCQLLDHGSGYLLALGVLRALAGRHHSGGAYTVDVSLLQTRNWLVSLGRTGTDALQAVDLDEATIASHTETRPSPWGSMTHVTQPGTIGGASGRWSIGPAVSGSSEPVWAS